MLERSSLSVVGYVYSIVSRHPYLKYTAEQLLEKKIPSLWMLREFSLYNIEN